MLEEGEEEEEEFGRTVLPPVMRMVWASENSIEMASCSIPGSSPKSS